MEFRPARGLLADWRATLAVRRAALFVDIARVRFRRFDAVVWIAVNGRHVLPVLAEWGAAEHSGLRRAPEPEYSRRRIQYRSCRSGHSRTNLDSAAGERADWRGRPALPASGVSG